MNIVSPLWASADCARTVETQQEALPIDATSTQARRLKAVRFMTSSFAVCSGKSDRGVSGK
jgi:hypothetical protein